MYTIDNEPPKGDPIGRIIAIVLIAAILAVTASTCSAVYNSIDGIW